MVDRMARDKYSTLLRRYATGRITNLVFEKQSDALIPSKDDAIFGIHQFLWPLYDDVRIWGHRRIGNLSLSREDRSLVAESIVFLHTSREYRWPVYTLTGILRKLLTFGRRPNWDTAHLDEDAWPFACRGEFDDEARKPRLLSGRH
jgi:hypothetical protein